ncbi:carcinoembryonic antigen-related cell adhesion molecule 19-like isoform X2 [Rana temporaria]|uniref:carcinoembryonic antigen-related cell adhesion molecule 19-like isoform X2 n=1 Tax=Rana temporaria TaxID=8407 RepID=UPI001AACA21F|nr:carcinoembryonic antigen-related cell adhesion molecule 19-like isoform X2 [Rana temporaria]
MTGLAVTVLLGVLVDVSSGMMSIQLIPQNPVIGGSVTLSVTGNTGTIRSFFWYKGSEMYFPCHILSYSPHKETPLTTGPMYNHRLTAFPNGSLLISNLTSTDQGHYVVKADLEEMVDEAFILLHVYDVSPDSGNVKKQAGCSVGSIVGTVLVVVFLLIVAGFLVYYTYKTRNQDNGPSVDTSIQLPNNENAQNTTMNSLQSNINLLQRNN